MANNNNKNIDSTFWLQTNWLIILKRMERVLHDISDNHATSDVF